MVQMGSPVGTGGEGFWAAAVALETLSAGPPEESLEETIHSVVYTLECTQGTGTRKPQM